MVVLSSILIFVAVCLAIFAIAVATAPDAATVRLARLRNAPGPIADAPTSDEGPGLLDEDSSWLVRVLTPLAGERAQRAASDAPEGSLRLRLVQAGFRRAAAPTIYLGGRIVLAVLLPLIAWLTGLHGQAPPGFELFALLGVAAIGYIGPSYWLDRRLKARQDEIDRHLPTALDLMVVCIEAGLGLVQSLSRVGAEMAGTSRALAEEFELVHLESRTGKSTADALHALAKRTGVNEVSVLVAMLVQTERFGTSLADALRVHCDTMRVTRMQRAEEQAAKAPLKMLFPTAMILFALLTLILGLAAIRASAVFG